MRVNFLDGVVYADKGPFDSSSNLSFQWQNLLWAEYGHLFLEQPERDLRSYFLSLGPRYCYDHKQEDDGLESSSAQGRRRFTRAMITLILGVSLIACVALKRKMDAPTPSECGLGLIYLVFSLIQNQTTPTFPTGKYC